MVSAISALLHKEKAGIDSGPQSDGRSVATQELWTWKEKGDMTILNIKAFIYKSVQRKMFQALTSSFSLSFSNELCSIEHTTE